MKKIIFFVIILILIGYSTIIYLMKNDKLLFVSSVVSTEQIQTIKQYIFPYRVIKEQKKQITKLENLYSPLKLDILFRSLPNIPIKKSEDLKLSNKKVMKRYKLMDGFRYGINLSYSGSGYLDFHQDNLIVLSVRGVLGYSKNIDKDTHFNQIKNNIDDFIGIKQFQKSHKFSLKDLLIYKNKIYVSFTEEIEEDCWNTSIIFGDMNYEEIVFKRFFSNEKCVHSVNNKDDEFEALQSGGRIINFNQDILLSIGDYRSRFLAQDIKSINGKIIKINPNSFEYEIFTMGHRNPQGLIFDKENNFLLETEHGPMGGDEINLIDIDKLNDANPLNYGWAISSAGEHYGGKDNPKNKTKYQKYPLYKSHSDYDFIEPLKSFVPSIGISEITKIGKNEYVASSLKDSSLYFFRLKDKKIINLERVEVFERVRDLIFKNKTLYLFLENSASIGTISLKK